MARSIFRSQKCKKLADSGHILRLGCGFAWQVQEILHLPKSEQNVRVFVAVSKMLAGVGSVKRFCKDAFCVAGAVQETVSSALSFPLLKEVSENCFVFDVGNLER